MNKKITVEIELSDWAKFVATDEDGEVWEYAEAPKPNIDVCDLDLSHSRHIATSQPNKNWKDSLIKVEDL